MKHAIGIVAFLCSTIAASAQTPKEKFIAYRLLLDRAETTAAHGEHALAADIYDSAFALVPFVGYDYFDAVNNALAAGRDDKANDLLIRATENGFVVEGMYQADLQAFMLSERCMPYLNMRDYMKSRWLAHADTSMIRKQDEVGSWYVTVEDSLGGLKRESDPDAFYRLLNLAEEFGWPTPLNVGSNYFRTQSLLLNQLDNYPDDPKWQQVLPFIRTAMDRGELPPDYLAPFQDMADLSHNRPMTYGIVLSYLDDDVEAWYMVDHETLEQNRLSVGLGPFEDYLFREKLDPEKVRYAEP